MKVLVTGARGQLGKAVVDAWQHGYQVTGTTSETMPLDDEVAIRQTIDKYKPELIIHAAAWTNVDEAARQPEAALAINGQGTRWLAEAAKETGARIVYISTNEVFDGSRAEPYTEKDPTHPINAYGVSKAAGEQAIQEVLPEGSWSIARVSWLYGPSSTRNFPNKIIQLADERGSLKVVDDEVSTPTYVPDVVAALQKVIEQPLSGILHLVNEGSSSRYEWAKKVLELTGRATIPVEPIKLADFQRASTPPPHAVLVNTVAKKAGIVLPGWQSSCADYCRLIAE